MLAAALAAAFLLLPVAAASALPVAHIEIIGEGSGEVVGVPGPTGGSPEFIECKYNGETEEQTGVCEAEAGEDEAIGLVGINVEHRELGGSEFGGWTIVEGVELGGSCSAFSKGCGVLSFGTPIRIKAAFETGGVVKFHLLAKKIGTGHGTVTSSPAGIDCFPGCGSEGAEFLDGSVVMLHAAADADSTFDGWTGCDAEPGGDCEVTMSEAREVEAEFNEVPQATLTLVKGGHAEGGTVTSSPAGIDCGPACEAEAAEFDEGETVTLTAAAEEGYVFAGWLGCKYVSAGVCEVTANGPLTEVTAVFVKDGEGVSVTPEPPGENCPNGGIKVASASGAEYVCNGEDGEVTVTCKVKGRKIECVVRTADERGHRKHHRLRWWLMHGGHAYAHGSAAVRHGYARVRLNAGHLPKGRYVLRVRGRGRGARILLG